MKSGRHFASSGAREETTGEDSRAPGGLLIASLSPLIFIGALFIWQLATLSTFRLDYPIIDDWRYYNPQTGMPDTLSIGWLIQPGKDTLHITGKLVDSLFFRFVAHDYHHLAVASFAICFGGYLVAALIVCLITARNRPAVRFASLLVFALPLAAMPYWVSVTYRQLLEPAVAYHQMLPVPGLLMLGVLCLVDRTRWPRGLDIAIAASATVAFSLAYSSGAIVLVVFGAVAALFPLLGGRLADTRLRSTAWLGIVIGAVAGLCLAAHIVAPMLAYNINPVLEPRSQSMAYPWTSRFWIFLFALFDRAVLSTASGGMAAVRGFGVAAIVIAPAIGLTILATKRRLDTKTTRLALVLVGTTLAVVAYTAVVSYGRGAFGEYFILERLPLGVRASVYAHHRFFYWWITAILPLSVIAWAIVLEAAASRRVAAVGSISLALLLVLPKAQERAGGSAYLRHWNYAALYQRDAAELAGIMEIDAVRARGKKAPSPRLAEWLQMPKSQRNPYYLPWEQRTFVNRRPLYARARSMGARFMEDSGLP